MGNLLIRTHLYDDAFILNFEDLQKGPEIFFNYYRMGISAFDEILTVYLGGRLIKININMRKAVTPAEKLSVTLR